MASSSAAQVSTSSSSNENARLLVIAGPSGVGKGTLVGRLRAEYPAAFGFSVSHTSRAPRPGEVNGVHYFFEKKEQIQEDVTKGLFLEHADVHGNMYGTSLGEVERIGGEGKICLLEIDVQGVRQVKASKLGHLAKCVFIRPPSLQVLEERLRGRGTETEDKVLKRLANAVKEIEDSESIGFDLVMINGELDAAYNELRDQVAAWYPTTIPAKPDTHTHTHTTTTTSTSTNFANATAAPCGVLPPQAARNGVPRGESAPTICETECVCDSPTSEQNLRIVTV